MAVADNPNNRLEVLILKVNSRVCKQISQVGPNIEVGCRLRKRLVQVVVHFEVGIAPMAARRVDFRLHLVDHCVLILVQALFKHGRFADNDISPLFVVYGLNLNSLVYLALKDLTINKNIL